MEYVVNALLSVVTALLAAAVLYLVFRPRIELRKHVLRVHHDWQDHPVYQVAYRNRGPFKAYDLHLETWLRMKTHPDAEMWQILAIPVRNSGHPYVPRSTKGWTRPELELKVVDWTSNFPPDKRPENPLDLEAILSSYESELYVAVAATTGLGGIRRARRKAYTASDVLDVDTE